MQNRLREALVRHWRWFWARAARARAVLGRIAARSPRNHRSGRSDEARAHFWAEFREGQREAEVRSVRLHP